MKAMAFGVATTLVVGLGGLGPAAAAPGKETAPPAMPRVKQVAAIVPELAGGVRELDRLSAVDGPGRTCRDNKVTKGVRGRSALYMPADLTKIDEFSTLVYVEAYRLKSVKEATKLARSYQRFVRRCAGKRIDGSTITRLALPKIGQQRVGLRTSDRTGYQGAASVVRRGRVVVVSLVGGDDEVSRADLVALTRLTVRTAK